MSRFVIVLALFIFVGSAVAAPVFVPHADAQAQSTVTKPPTGQSTDPYTVFGPVMGFIMSLFGLLLTVAGVLLNQAVQITVVTMGDYVHSIAAIEIAWRVLRDLGNIILIFGFIAIGITTILSVNWYGGGTKMLPTLLLAAIFLNFSLFVAEAVVDVGNLFATQVYTQINGGTLNSSGLVASGGISDTIMNQIGLQTLLDVSGNQKTGLLSFDFETIVAGFLGILLFMIAAFVFFSLAFMLIARFVILILLIIVSPLGFAGLAVPKLEGIARKWWEQLFMQSLTAPVLLLTLYVALLVITDPQFLASFGTDPTRAGNAYRNLAVFSNPDDLQQFAGVILSFFVAMGLLMACVIIAKQMSAFGASWATKWGGALSFGAAAFAGRQTVGRYAYSKAKKWENTEFGRSMAGRILTTNILTPVSKASFDARATAAFKAAAPGVDAGKVYEGGYKKGADEAIKARLEYGKTLKSTDEEKEHMEKLEKGKAFLNRQKGEELKKLEATHLADQKTKRLASSDMDQARQKVKSKEAALANATQSGNTVAMAAADSEHKKALQEEASLLEHRKQLMADQAKEYKAEEGMWDSRITSQENTIKRMKGMPMEQYVDNLRSSTPLGRLWVNYDAKAVNTAAAEALAKDRDKTDAQRVVDALNSSIDRLGSVGGGGGSSGAPKP